jgi:hypothetical protein
VKPEFSPTRAANVVTYSASAVCSGQGSVRLTCVPDGTPPDLDYGGLSQCQRGRCEMLVDGTPVCCGFVGSPPEICDGLDNDCDGEIDNGVTCPEGTTCQGIAGCV